jgi:hypothetical protein
MFKDKLLMKILLSVATVAVVTVAAVGGTFANFTATPTSIGSNAFATGQLIMNSSSSSAIFSASAMKIGDSATGSITISNVGSLAGAYTLSGSSSGSATLLGQLNLKIYADTDNSGSPIYNGTLGGFSSTSLGTFAATTGSHTYYFHVSLPTTGADATDNAFQGLSASETFTWSAVQA